MEPGEFSGFIYTFIMYIHNAQYTLQEWSKSIGKSQKPDDEDAYEKWISLKIRLRNEHIAIPAKINLEFTWSTRLDNCDKSSKGCPMKDPRSTWVEELQQQAWINMGIIWRFFAPEK